MQKLIVPTFAICALLAGAVRGNFHALVTVDPNADWIGYVNVFALPADGGGYIFGSVRGTSALQAGFTSTSVLIQPCTNVWETTDAFYVQTNGTTPNKIMDANFYVQDDSLVNSNVVFIGTCLSNTLTANPERLTGVSYTTVAFIKIFDGNYNNFGTVTSKLIAGQAFSIKLSTAGAAHVQYGFETIGPDANPSTVSALGNVQVALATPAVTVAVDPSQNWIGYLNVIALPVGRLRLSISQRLGLKRLANPFYRLYVH